MSDMTSVMGYQSESRMLVAELVSAIMNADTHGVRSLTHEYQLIRSEAQNAGIVTGKVHDLAVCAISEVINPCIIQPAALERLLMSFPEVGEKMKQRYEGISDGALCMLASAQIRNVVDAEGMRHVSAWIADTALNSGSEGAICEIIDSYVAMTLNCDLTDSQCSQGLGSLLWHLGRHQMSAENADRLHRLIKPAVEAIAKIKGVFDVRFSTMTNLLEGCHQTLGRTVFEHGRVYDAEAKGHLELANTYGLDYSEARVAKWLSLPTHNTQDGRLGVTSLVVAMLQLGHTQNYELLYPKGKRIGGSFMDDVISEASKAIPTALAAFIQAALPRQKNQDATIKKLHDMPQWNEIREVLAKCCKSTRTVLEVDIDL